VIESPLQRRAPLPPQLTRRVSVLGIVVFLLFGVIAFRLWYLQVLTGTQNAAKATANIVRDITVPAPRGNTAAPVARHAANAASTSAASRGLITPTGICR